MRLIDADALKQRIREKFDGLIERIEINSVINAQPTADIPQWIPCSEGLPYSQEDVLCDDDGRVTIGYYTDEEIGWHDTHSYKIYPTAWMPLPEPWKGEAE